MTVINHFSLSTLPLEQYFRDQRLGQGTGFVWEWFGKFYLVTNWHVLSMRDFFKRENLHEHAARPDFVRTHIDTSFGSFNRQQWDLPTRSEEDAPLWLIHPSRRVDVAVLPLPFTADHPTVHITALNSMARPQGRLDIGQDVFILGYPLKIAPPTFPIWKRGSIATEPALVRMTTDYLLVDTASRPGMSGAPVIKMGDVDDVLDISRLVGIYSGRLPTDFSHELQLGLVWDARLIEEILQGGLLDDGRYD